MGGQKRTLDNTMQEKHWSSLMNRLMEEPDSKEQQNEIQSGNERPPKNLITYLNLKLKDIHNCGRRPM